MLTKLTRLSHYCLTVTTVKDLKITMGTNGFSAFRAYDKYLTNICVDGPMVGGGNESKTTKLPIGKWVTPANYLH